MESEVYFPSGGQHRWGSPGLQVAMETEQDAVCVAVKLEQRGDESRETREEIALQTETSGGLG